MEKCRYGCKKGKVFMEAFGTLVPCPDHGSIERLIERNEEGKIPLYEELYIPLEYEDASVCGKELFDVGGVDKFSRGSINAVANMLERINKDVYAGRVTKTSVYIYVPNNLVDIKRYVYGLQKMAVEMGLQVTRYSSVNDLYALQRVGDYSTSFLEEGHLKTKEINPDLMAAVDGYKFMKKTGLAYRDFVNADLCILRATAATINKGWYGLADLLDSRSAKGLPTYVMGYWPTKTFGVSGGARFLLAPENGRSRLDLLTPFELKAKSHSDDVNETDSVLDEGTGGFATKPLIQ